MLQDAMDWAGHQLVALARLNLDDRPSVITQADAHRIEQALTAALAVLNPPAEQSLQARREFVRVLTSGIAPGETRQAIADAGLRSDGVDYAEDDGAISGVVIPAPR